MGFFSQEQGGFLGDVALLLYGSPRNLAQMQYSPTLLTLHHLDSAPWALRDFLVELGYDDETDETTGSVDFYWAGQFFERLGRFARAPVARAHMAGYAKVVDVQDNPRVFVSPDGTQGSRSPSRLVIASPLFVEYTRE
jgi:hypothetical protein